MNPFEIHCPTLKVPISLSNHNITTNTRILTLKYIDILIRHRLQVPLKHVTCKAWTVRTPPRLPHPHQPPFPASTSCISSRMVLPWLLGSSKLHRSKPQSNTNRPPTDWSRTGWVEEDHGANSGCSCTRHELQNQPPVVTVVNEAHCCSRGPCSFLGAKHGLLT